MQHTAEDLPGEVTALDDSPLVDVKLLCGLAEGARALLAKFNDLLEPGDYKRRVCEALLEPTVAVADGVEKSRRIVQETALCGESSLLRADHGLSRRDCCNVHLA